MFAVKIITNQEVKIMFLEITRYNFTGTHTEVRRYTTLKYIVRYIYNFLHRNGNYNYSKEFITFTLEHDGILFTNHFTFTI